MTDNHPPSVSSNSIGVSMNELAIFNDMRQYSEHVPITLAANHIQIHDIYIYTEKTSWNVPFSSPWGQGEPLRGRWQYLQHIFNFGNPASRNLEKCSPQSLPNRRRPSAASGIGLTNSPRFRSWLPSSARTKSSPPATALLRGDQCPRWSQLSHVESVIVCHSIVLGSRFTFFRAASANIRKVPFSSSLQLRFQRAAARSKATNRFSWLSPIPFSPFSQYRRFPSIRDPEMNVSSNLYPMQCYPILSSKVSKRIRGPYWVWSVQSYRNG